MGDSLRTRGGRICWREEGVCCALASLGHLGYLVCRAEEGSGEKELSIREQTFAPCASPLLFRPVNFSEQALGNPHSPPPPT